MERIYKVLAFDSRLGLLATYYLNESQVKAMEETEGMLVLEKKLDFILGVMKCN